MTRPDDRAVTFRDVTWDMRHTHRPPNVGLARGITQLGLYKEDFAVGKIGVVHILVDTRGRKYVGKEIINVSPKKADGELMHETEGPRRLPNRRQHRFAQVHGVVDMQFGPDDHRRLLVQDYVEGPEASEFMESLHRELGTDGLIREGDEWQAIMMYAWDLISTVAGPGNDPDPKKNIVHSDLKPANVRISAADGRPVVFDLGGWVPSGWEFGMSTQGYAAPESKALQLRTPADAHLPVAMDERSDLYSVGRMLEEMVLNRDAIEFRKGHHERPHGRLAKDQRKVSEYLDLVRLLQAEDKSDRPWAQQLLSHPQTQEWHPFFQGLDFTLASRISRTVIRTNEERKAAPSDSDPVPTTSDR